MIPIHPEQVSTLAPHAKPNYSAAFGAADAVLAKYGINDTARRLAHFMAQVLHESGNLSIYEESLTYTHASVIRSTWPSRFPTVADAEPYVRQPEKLANLVYSGRMGNTHPGDGFKYHGRGLIQITGYEDYDYYGKRLGIDMIANPDLAFSAEWCLAVAAEEWTRKGCNAFADKNDLTAITKRINGGLIGLAERQAQLVRTSHVWA